MFVSDYKTNKLQIGLQSLKILTLAEDPERKWSPNDTKLIAWFYKFSPEPGRSDMQTARLCDAIWALTVLAHGIRRSRDHS